MAAHVIYETSVIYAARRPSRQAMYDRSPSRALSAGPQDEIRENVDPLLCYKSTVAPSRATIVFGRAAFAWAAMVSMNASS